MAKNIIITVNAKSNAVKVNTPVVGAIGENLQGLFIVEFTDSDYIDGACWLEINSDEKGYIELSPTGNNTYTAPIKSGITKYRGNIEAQVRITQAEVDGEVPVFKSDIFNLNTLASINALEEIPEEYPKWIDSANAKLAECDEAIERMSEFGGKLRVVYVKPQFQGGNNAKEWEAVTATRFKIKVLQSELGGLIKPYIDDVIVYKDNGTMEKAILETAELINGDLLIYSNLEIDCKIIIKGD